MGKYVANNDHRVQGFALLSHTLLSESKIFLKCREGSRDGAVVIALASHQCGPGSIPGPDAISGLSLCLFSSLFQGFFSGLSAFPPLAKTSMQLIPSGCGAVLQGRTWTV